MISEVLNKAADIIDRDGWYDGIGPIPNMTDGNKACTIMAIYRAAGREYKPPFYTAIRAVEKHIGGVLLAVWNDRQTSKDDVTGMLRTVAELQESVTETPQ